MKKEVLRMEHVTLRHAGRNVLEDFHLNIYEGEFLFVYGYPDSGIRELGELLKGSRKADKGRFYFEETEISAGAFENPGSFGIYLVQNENNLIEDFTVAENLFFGGGKRFFQKVTSIKKQEQMAVALLKKFGIEDIIDPKSKVRNLPYDQRIILKIIMAYIHDAKLLILDRIMGFDLEQGYRHILSKALQILQNDGTAIMWMNQRMDDAWNKADRVLVMQGGKNVRTIYKGYEGALDDLLSHAMENGANASQNVKTNRERELSSSVVFSMSCINSSFIRNMSLSIRRGEVISICSTDSMIMQNFRNILTGMDTEYQGEMKLERDSYRPGSYTDSVKQGVVYLDMMWYEKHCNPEMSIEDNIMIPIYWRHKGIMGIWQRGLKSHARYLYRINYPDWPKDYWWKLTADQQKALLMEKLCMEPHKLVIITEPFFQLHNTMLEDFYRLIRKIQEKNEAVILMAAFDRDVRPVSDRVIFLDQWTKKQTELPPKGSPV